MFNRGYINISVMFLCLGLSLIIWLIVNSIFNNLLNPGLHNYYNLIFQFLVSITISPVIIFIHLFLLKKMSI